MSYIGDIDEETDIIKLRSLLRESRSNEQIAAHIGINLAEQNAVLMKRLDNTELELDTIKAKVEEIRRDRQEHTETSLIIHRLCEENRRIINDSLKCTQALNGLNKKIQEFEKLHLALNEEMLEFKNLVATINAFRRRTNEKMAKILHDINKIQTDMAAEKTASIETKDRLDKLETTNNRKRAEISNKMSFLEFDVVEILGYLRNIEKSIAEFATRFENNEEKVKFLLGKLSEISDKSDKVINDVSAVRTEVELNNICLQWSPLIKLNSAPRSLSFEDENLVTLKSEHVMCAESKNSIAKDDLPGLEMQNGSAFSIPNCGKEHIEISTQDNDVGEQKHDTNYNSQSNSKNASELISLEVELFAEASKFSQGGSLGRNKYAKSELGTNSTPSRRPARAQNLTPNIIKNSTFDTNITNLDTTPINNTESAWNSARPDFSSLNSSRNTFSSSNFVGTLFLSSGQIGLRYNDLWKPNSSSRYS